MAPGTKSAAVKVEKSKKMAPVAAKTDNMLSKKGEDAKVGKGKARKESFGIYIHKVSRQVHPELTISTRAMGVMNNFVNDMFERIASEACTLAQVNKKQRTLGLRDVETAVKLMLPGELAKHAVSEGQKAWAKYSQSVEGND